MLGFLVLGFSVPAVRAQIPTAVYTDAVGDALARRVDPGADGLLDPIAHRWPDLVNYTIGQWAPLAPSYDLFTGSWYPYGEFMRIDLVFNGLVNPPGALACCGDPAWDPFRYGPHPLFAYIELDVDADENTGGEITWPNLRYLGNVARYGGLPSDPWAFGRVALNESAFDGVLATPPFVDRSGEDFHIAMFGWEIDTIYRSDLSDNIFGPGETWTLIGTFLQRSHAYEPFSYACCQGPNGSYIPSVEVRFRHRTQTGQTTVSLVYPLSNLGSFQYQGGMQLEPLDGDASNQNSILEATDDLVFSAANPTPQSLANPNFPIIANWQYRSPDFQLSPADWRVRILVGTSYLTQEPAALVVWTDLAPDVVVGDFDGSGSVNSADRALFDLFIAQNDGETGLDDDGQVNGSVDLPNFGPNFSLFDVNYDGLVNELDWDAIPGIAQAPADFNGDADVDLGDFGFLQVCLTGSGVRPPAPGCEDTDLDQDGDVDSADMAALRACFSGADIPADPLCGR